MEVIINQLGNIEVIPQQIPVLELNLNPVPIRGESAFETAVRYGYPLTEKQWVWPFIFTESFVSLWDTRNVSQGSSSSNNQIRLPFIDTGIYNCLIDWGDGTTNTVTTWNDPNLLHTYSTGGGYIIKISGVCRGWRFNNTGDRLKMLNIHQWGTDFRLGTNQGNYFHGCSNLRISAVDILNTVDITNFSNLFRNCSSLSMVPNMNLWNVRNVDNMTFVFANCTNFNQPLNNWNVENVNNMGSMFANCTNFNQPLNNWNVRNVRHMTSMFVNANNWGTQNYSAALIQWSRLPLRRNVVANFGTNKYSLSAATARQNIITNFNWAITDGGLA
jgi:surface protein